MAKELLAVLLELPITDGTVMHQAGRWDELGIAPEYLASVVPMVELFPGFPQRRAQWLRNNSSEDCTHDLFYDLVRILARL